MQTKNVGHMSAWSLARSRGYTGTREEFAQLMADYATVAERAAQSAQDAESAKDYVDEQTQIALQAAQDAAASAQSASGAHDDAASARTSAQNALQSETDALNYKNLAQRQAENSEAWAVGTRDGVDVGTQDETYHNNAKYYAGQLGTAVETATTAATNASQSAQDAATSASQAAESARTLTIDSTLTQAGQAADAKETGDEITGLKEDLNAIESLLDISESLTWSAGYITSNNGDIHAQVNDKYQYYSSLINASDFLTLIVKPSPTRQIKIAKYNKDTGAWVETDLWTSDAVTLDNTYSIRVNIALLNASATEVTKEEQVANVSILEKASGDMSFIPVVESVYVQVGGATSASNKYVKATGIDLKKDNTITAKDGYQFAVYNSGNSQITGGWQSAFTMTANASGVTIVIRKTGGVGTIDKENEGLTLYSYIVENYKSTGNRAFIINDNAVNDLVSRMPVNNRWKGKKAAFIGDSITYGVHTTKKYYDLLDAEIGFSSVYADGVEGSGYSTAGSGGHTPIVDRTVNIPTDCDLVVIFAGTNDFGHGAPLGTIADNTDVSFYGAMIKTITDIITAMPSTRLVLMTPLHRTGTTYMSEDDTNTQGLVLADYVEAEKKVAERYSIPVIDLWSISGLAPRIPIIKTTYMSDGLHPDTAGHMLLADRILPQLNDL